MPLEQGGPLEGLALASDWRGRALVWALGRAMERALVWALGRALVWALERALVWALGRAPRGLEDRAGVTLLGPLAYLVVIL